MVTHEGWTRSKEELAAMEAQYQAHLANMSGKRNREQISRLNSPIATIYDERPEEPFSPFSTTFICSQQTLDHFFSQVDPKQVMDAEEALLYLWPLRDKVATARLRREEKARDE